MCVCVCVCVCVCARARVRVLHLGVLSCCMEGWGGRGEDKVGVCILSIQMRSTKSHTEMDSSDYNFRKGRSVCGAYIYVCVGGGGEGYTLIQ